MEKITKQDPQSQSADIVTENIEKLLALFPEIITEGDGEKKVDIDVLKEVLGEYIEDKEERYSFTWHGKSRARRLAQTPSTGTLRPCEEESVNWDTTQNLFIEGDNLEVLKLLQKSYHKKVKMIYIDPPYNTGQEFIYPDKYQDNLDTYLKYTGQKSEEGLHLSPNVETSGRYHTNWMNMMYPRLKLAKNLLRDDGLIFISIDNIEIANLRKIADEIFGEENFVEQASWKNKYGAGAKTKGFIEVHEYILCYSKKPITNIASQLSDEQKEEYKLKDEKYPVRGGYVTQPLMTTSLGDRENLQYKVEYNGDIIAPRKQWVWSEERLLKAISNDEIVFKKKANGEYSVRAKVYLYDEEGNIRKGKPLSLLNGPFNQSGTKETEELLGKGVFDFPKPSELIKYFFSFSVNDNDDSEGIYLDFFSGSCASAHAILNLNLEDSGVRRFIMVQLPELIDGNTKAINKGYNTIADIGKDRIRKLSEKIIRENTEYTGDIGFKVFKLDATNINPWDADFDTLEDELALSVDSIKSDRTAEDVLYEILLKYGLDLTLPVEQHEIDGKAVYNVGMGALMVCLDDAISIEVVEGIGKLKEELQPEVMRVVFKDASFADDVVKTNAVQVLKQFGIDDVRSI